MPREVAIGDVLAPGLLPLFVLMLGLLWLLDWAAGRYGLYRHVWHPSLFRLAVFVGAFSGLGLLLF